MAKSMSLTTEKKEHREVAAVAAVIGVANNVSGSHSWLCTRFGDTSTTATPYHVKGPAKIDSQKVMTSIFGYLRIWRAFVVGSRQLLFWLVCAYPTFGK